ncbi:hypothetical protein Bca4012_026856 [Brassica carinata]
MPPGQVVAFLHGITLDSNYQVLLFLHGITLDYPVVVFLHGITLDPNNQVLAFLHGLFSVLKEDCKFLTKSGKEEKGSDAETDQRKADKDLRERSLLGTCVSDFIPRKIMPKTTASEM